MAYNIGMQITDQTRTSKGFIPVSGAAEVQNDDGDFIEFACLAARDITEEDQAQRFGLEDLAVLCRGADNKVEIRRENLISFAAKCGPLFLHENKDELALWHEGKLRENLADWVYASMVASWTVTVQEILNGTLATSSQLKEIEKTVAKSVKTGSEFTYYTTCRPLGTAGSSAYFESMPKFPWMRKFTQESGCDYAVMTVDEEEGQLLLSAYLFCFPEELTRDDYLAILDVFDQDEDIRRALQDALEFEEEGSLGLLAEEDNLMVRSEPIGPDDYPHLQRLIYAITSLHLQGVHVDVFNSTEGEDFMAFDTYLSFLWYNFAKQSSRVRIAYCVGCGKGFSLTHSRGIPQRFCSPECKTRIKNERMKNLADDIRARFMDGQSVEQIGQAKLAGKTPREREDQVLTKLRSWPELKQRRDAAIVLKGKADLALVRRCLEEGVWTKEEFIARAEELESSPRKKRDVRAKEAKKRKN